MKVGNKTLRGYQVELIDKCRSSISAGRRELILALATGAGKTAIACYMIQESYKRGLRSTFVAPRRELIRQTSEHLYECGIDRHGTILSGDEPIPEARIQVASKDTLATRVLRKSRMDLPPTDLLFIDECRSSTAPEYRKLIHRFQEENSGLVTIGLDATPTRSDGTGLGAIYKEILTGATYRELIAAGYLVPVTAYGFLPASMQDAKNLSDSQWEKEAAIRADNPTVVGDVVDHWERLASDRPTICFTSRVAHSLHLRDEFRKRGIACDHVDGKTDADIRASTVARLKSGELQVITNVGCFVEGFDEPRVSCIILACPVRSLTKYRQMSGRALRPYPGKEDMMLIDHGGAVLMHGWPDDDITWHLGSVSRMQREKERLNLPEEKEPMHCSNCGHQFRGSRICPMCGFEKPRRGREIAFERGLLTFIPRRNDSDLLVKNRIWKRCLGMAANTGRTCGAAAGMYNSQTGEMPWETVGLKEMPPRGAWKQRACDVYPRFCKRRGQ